MLKPDSYSTGDQRLEMIPFLPENYHRVLEVGCGEGAFSRNLSQTSERWGVELDDTVAEKAKPLFYRVLVGKYEQVMQDLPDDYFDLVICNDVIEHMEDHDFFLKSVKTKMKTGGTLVASIPNIRYLKVLFELMVKKDWRYRPHGTLYTGHLRFFTRKSLLRTLSEHGFKIRKFKGINRAGRTFLTFIPVALLLVLTLGYYRDSLYVQYGFAAEK